MRRPQDPGHRVPQRQTRACLKSAFQVTAVTKGGILFGAVITHCRVYCREKESIAGYCVQTVQWLYFTKWLKGKHLRHFLCIVPLVRDAEVAGSNPVAPTS